MKARHQLVYCLNCSINQTCQCLQTSKTGTGYHDYICLYAAHQPVDQSSPTRIYIRGIAVPARGYLRRKEALIYNHHKRWTEPLVSSDSSFKFFNTFNSIYKIQWRQLAAQKRPWMRWWGWFWQLLQWLLPCRRKVPRWRRRRLLRWIPELASLCRFLLPSLVLPSFYLFLPCWSIEWKFVVC